MEAEDHHRRQYQTGGSDGPIRSGKVNKLRLESLVLQARTGLFETNGSLDA